MNTEQTSKNVFMNTQGVEDNNGLCTSKTRITCVTIIVLSLFSKSLTL